MGVPSRVPTVIAWVVVAIVVAWAPLFHAICIAPAESAAATTHVMADGTVMMVAASASDSGHSGHAMDDRPSAVSAAEASVTPPATGSAASASAVPSTTLLDATGVVGVIVVFAGLAVLTMALFARYCRVIPSRADPPRRRTPRPTWFDTASWRWTDVDLHSLGISRT